MTSEEVFTLEVTASEVEWILTLLQAPTMRLYPFLGETAAADDSGLSLDAAQASLLKRGWIIVQDDQISLDIAVGGIVGALAFAQKSLWVQVFRGQELEPEIVRYYTVEGLLVEQTTRSAGELCLTAMENAAVLNTRLVGYLGVDAQTAPAQGNFRCAEEDFAEVPYLLAGNGKAEAIAELVQLGADARWSSEFVGAMESPLCQATLQVIGFTSDDPPEAQQIAKLTVIEGIYGLWAIRLEQERDPVMTTIVPCAAQQAKSYLAEIVSSLVA